MSSYFFPIDGAFETLLVFDQQTKISLPSNMVLRLLVENQKIKLPILLLVKKYKLIYTFNPFKIFKFPSIFFLTIYTII